MIWHVARKEFREIIRDGRFLWAAVIIVALLLMSLGIGASRYGQDRALREDATREVRAQWLGQGAKGPHSAAHYGVYAFKPATPLALFDPGYNDFTGTLAFLEAHKENRSSYMPAQDATALQRFGDLSGAMILQLLMPLLIILLSFAMIAGEREDGTLRQLLSVGARRFDLIAGKAFGVIGTIGLVLIPAILVGGVAAALMIRVDDPHDLIDFPGKLGLLALCYAAFLSGFVFLGLAVSIRSRSSRAALTALVAFWIVAGLLLPRLASDIGQRLYPHPSALELATIFERGRDSGPRPHEPNHPNNKRWRAALLQQYGVKRIEDLPFGYMGLAFQADEDHTNVIFDRHYGGLRRTYERQDVFQQALGLISPFIAIRSVSAALSGTDVHFFNRFDRAGELYRRSLIRVMNRDLMIKTAGRDMSYGEWDYKADGTLWRRVPPFDFDAPPLAQIVRESATGLIALLVWFAGSAVFLFLSARSMRIDA